MADVEWGAGERAEVEDAAELDELLERLDAEARAARKPRDVQVTVAGAGTLGIVVGADRSLLNHVPADLDPPYRVSVGGTGGDELFTFHVAGDHYSETLRRHTIAPGVARAAIRHFLETGELSPAVRWEEA